MKDLTQGSIVSHILSMAPPIVAGMVTIMICQLVDLYFVAGLGEAAIAGVAAAGNAGFLINALMQVLGVGTVALISHAVGRKDRADANLVFNQSLGLSAACGLLTWVAGSVLAGGYMRLVAADEATVEAGTTYLLWFMPALALQFAMQVMASALRGTGIVRPSMIVQALAVIINIALAPVLIAGWGTGHAFGVAGAGLASSIAVLIGVLMLWMYFRKLEHYVGVDPAQLRPRLAAVEAHPQCRSAGRRRVRDHLHLDGRDLLRVARLWRGGSGRIWHRDARARPHPDAGAGDCARRRADRRAEFRRRQRRAREGNLHQGGADRHGRDDRLHDSCAMEARAVARWLRERPSRRMAVAALFLQMVSLNLVAQGLNFVCSSMFQGLGNTKPVLLSSGSRLITYAVPVMWLSAQARAFASSTCGTCRSRRRRCRPALSLWLLRREFRKRLAPFKSALPAE